MANRPARRNAHKKSMAETDDDHSDDFGASNEKDKGKGKNQQAKMSYAQEDIFISSVLQWFDVVENKSTDKSLSQSNKKKATEAWENIQTEFEQETNVSNAQICWQCSSW